MKDLETFAALIPLRHRALVATRGITLSILLLDRSGSMRSFGRTPVKATNDLIASLKRSDAAPTTGIEVITFADTAELAIPLVHVESAPSLTTYEPTGATRLYLVVKEVIERLLEITDRTGTRVNVVLSVVTDGRNEPPRDEPDPPGAKDDLIDAVARALERNWDLHVYGIGVDAEKIAADMGFPADETHAHTLGRSAASVHASMQAVSHHTILTAMGFSVRPDTPPPSSPR